MYNLYTPKVCSIYFRILPMYITVIAIFALFLPYMGDGPLWKYFIHTEVEYCHKNWWTNMLFINNYVNSHKMVIIVYYCSSLYNLYVNPNKV